MTDPFLGVRGERAPGARTPEPHAAPYRREAGRVPGGPTRMDDRSRAARLSSIVKFVGQLAAMPTEDEIVHALIQAAAVWYDLDTRAYRRDGRERFVLRQALAGANLSDCPAEVIECPVKPIRVSSLVELARLGWRNPLDDVLLVPINVQAQSEWLVTAIGSADSDAESELTSLCSVIGTLFDRLAARRADDLHLRLARTATGRRGPAPEVSSAMLAEIAVTVSAAQACVWAALDDDRIVSLASVGPPMAPLLRHRDVQPVATAERILVPVAGRGGSAGAIDLRSAPDKPFTPEHAGLAAAGAASFAMWLAGLDIGSTRVVEPSPAINVETRLREEVERARRFGLTIGLLIFNVTGPRGQGQPEQVGATLLNELRGQLRACDYIGLLDQGGLAIIFAQTDSRGLTAALQRITQRLDVITKQSHLPAIRVGKAVYPAHAESASELLMQARLAAESPAGSIM